MWSRDPAKIELKVGIFFFLYFQFSKFNNFVLRAAIAAVLAALVRPYFSLRNP